eukprot:TRINITY_DN14464_c0_g2_i2.p1 TRINITY_DN14464_c0_g2~~TRINITY_DN14464_c0_g2_i2.p1  ORF type:complete len:815 (-),score=158.40 TRINITY_DN14464_c0_g2_i2:162-2606(-)
MCIRDRRTPHQPHFEDMSHHNAGDQPNDHLAWGPMEGEIPPQPTKHSPVRTNEGNRDCPLNGCNQVLNLFAVPEGGRLTSPCDHWAIERSNSSAKVPFRAFCCIAGCTKSYSMSSKDWKKHWNPHTVQGSPVVSSINSSVPAPTPGYGYGVDQGQMEHLSDLTAMAMGQPRHPPPVQKVEMEGAWPEDPLQTGFDALNLERFDQELTVFLSDEEQIYQDQQLCEALEEFAAHVQEPGPAAGEGSEWTLVDAPTIQSLSPQDVQMSLHTTGTIRLWKRDGVAQPFQLDLGHSPLAELPVLVDRGAGNPVLAVTVGSTRNQELQFKRYSPAPLGCPQDKDLLMISFEAPPVQLRAEPWAQRVLLELECSPGIAQVGWWVWHRDADKALDQQAIENAHLRAQLAALLRTAAFEPSSKRSSNDNTNSPNKKGSRGPGTQHMTGQQMSQQMEGTARRALDTYRELMVEHPLQTLKWVESCTESVALLCAGQAHVDSLNEELHQAIAHLHHNLSEAPKALALQDAVCTAEQRCSFFKRECPAQEALHRQMDQELAQAVQHHKEATEATELMASTVCVTKGDPCDRGEYDLASRVIDLKDKLDQGQTDFRLEIAHCAVLHHSLLFLARLCVETADWEVLESDWDVEATSGWAHLNTTIPYQIAIGQPKAIGAKNTPLDEYVMFATSPSPKLTPGGKTRVTLYIYNELFEELLPPGCIRSAEASRDLKHVLRRECPVTIGTRAHPDLLGSGTVSGPRAWDGRIIEFDFEVEAQEGAAEGLDVLEFYFENPIKDGLEIGLEFEVAPHEAAHADITSSAETNHE